MQFDKDRKIVQLDGGVGRVICAEPAIRQLAEGHDVDVITAWPEVFQGAVDVRVYPLDRGYLFNDVIRHGDFKMPEPYHDWRYYRQKLHLIETFHVLLCDDSSTGYVRPCLRLTEQEDLAGAELVANLPTRQVFAFQPFGSQAQDQNGVIVDPTHRSMPWNLAMHLVNAFPDVSFLNCSHIEIRHPRVFNYKLRLRELFGAVNACDAVITVDSLCQHVAYSLEKPTLSVMGGSYPQNVGYPHEHLVVTRPTYPRSYPTNRIGGAIDLNQGAMDFTEHEAHQTVTSFKEYLSEKGVTL